MKKIVEKLESKKNLMVENIKDKKGFTLIELIVVMAIMAILVLVAAPMFLNYTKDAAVTSMEQDARVISDAAFQSHIATEKWPTADGASATELEFYVASEAGVQTAPVTAIDPAALDSYISSTSNDIDEYVIVAEPGHEREGEVFYVGTGAEGENFVHDRNNNERIGLDGARINEVELD